MKKIKLHGRNATGKYEFALVDDNYYAFLSRLTWFAKTTERVNREGKTVKVVYAVTYIWHADKKLMFLMHRLIMNASPTKVIDHEDGNTINNQEYNLRPANRRQNSQNTHKSKFKGCSYDSRSDTWWGRIKVDGKQLGLGCYDTEIDCAIAYNHAALKHFGEFAQFNRIPNWRDKQPVLHKKVHNHHQSNNKSGIPGVCYHKSTGKWQANLTYNKKSLYLGTYATIEEAAKVRREAEIKYYGHLLDGEKKK